jgi:hypothetical protein
MDYYIGNRLPSGSSSSNAEQVMKDYKQISLKAEKIILCWFSADAKAGDDSDAKEENGIHFSGETSKLWKEGGVSNMSYTYGGIHMEGYQYS